MGFKIVGFTGIKNRSNGNLTTNCLATNKKN